MTRIFRTFLADYTKVTSVLLDYNYNGYLWIAQEKHPDDTGCYLTKTTAFDLGQTAFSTLVPVDKIVKMANFNYTYLYLAVEKEGLLGYRYSFVNPASSYVSIAKPVGIEEYAVDVQTYSNQKIFYLTPGIASGENAKIVVYTSSGVYDETIDLIQSGEVIRNAVSFTVASGGEMWVVTSDTPAKLVRVYLDGGNYVFSTTELN